ncbi:preprotein translocase subunit YajC [Frigoribacterium sp. CFBP 13712]|uniref:preprotein translocase subunit YajC n=1 Tax=Frigoribacterium sp. CFBP 13712 TaxID=2775309 RepID=UPI00177E4B94|nr:preprotein translocase subunit YajC [Frigoribacterium sp. CFBP 13712]MBD8703418.1 preprotein translocase subunit YajC [Frigoribacterium sp. CFBP 13712]
MDATTLIMVLLLVVLVFFMFRNKKKRDNQQADLQRKMVPGVEVMLTFGLYGTVVSIDDETNVAEVEVAPGTIVKVHRQTLGRVVEPVVVETSSETDGDDALDRPVIDSTSTGSLDESPTYGERADEPRIDTTPSKDSDKPTA